MKTKKLLFVTEEYPPVVGGVGVSSERVARNLANLGCDVTIATFDASRPLTDDSYVLTEVTDGVRILRVGPFFNGQPGLLSEQLLESIRATHRRRIFDLLDRIAHEIRPEVVLSFYLVNAGLLGLYIARSLGVPHVAGVRGVDIGRNIFSFREISVVSTIVGGSASIACVNEVLRQRLLLLCPEARSKITVIPNAVDQVPNVSSPRSRNYLKSHTKWHEEDVVAVFIGSPREKKGIGVLFRALELLPTTSSLRLLIVGSAISSKNPFFGELATKLAQEGRLHSTGHVIRAQALLIAAEADIVVMPSLEDGMANGLLEGMALGLSPLVTDIFRDVLSEESAIMVPRGNAQAIATGLMKYAASPELRKRTGEAARKIILEKHLPSREATDYFELFTSVLS